MVLIALFAACGKPFNVRPRTALPAANYIAKSTSDGITLQAEAITDENLLYDTFDANLIVAGILPVRVKLSNSGTDPVELRKARFEVRDASGRSFKSSSAQRAFKRLVSYYEISAYSKAGFKESRADFSAHALDIATPIPAGESREGLLFFVTSEAASGTGFTLVGSRLSPSQPDKQPIEIRLN